MEPPPFILSNKFLITSIVGTILFLFGAVLMFSRNAFIPEFEISGKANEIGDAINGITAPITSLLGSVLLFISFRTQFEANRLIQSQWEYDTFIREFDGIEKEFNNLKYHYTENTNNFIGVEVISNEITTNTTFLNGSEAIEHFMKQIDSHLLTGNPIAIMNDISYILEELSALLNDVTNSKLTKTRQSFLFRRINRFYIIKIENNLITIFNKFDSHKKNYPLEENQKYPYEDYFIALNKIITIINNLRQTKNFIA